MLNKSVIADLHRFKNSGRLNDPDEYIRYLKTQGRFKRLSIDTVPPYAILLHDSRTEDALVSLGYSPSDYVDVQTGSTDPNVVFFIAGRNGAPDFLVNRGLPGGGGAATQAAELFALGVRSLVHIGTCGLVGDQVGQGQIVAPFGAYKDAAAALLTSGDDDMLVYSDDRLRSELASALGDHAVSGPKAIGYTIPIFYWQPLALIRGLLDGSLYPKLPPVSYFEMEQASVFATAHVMGESAASLVVGSDRYWIKDGEVTHRFEDFDQHAAEVEMMKAALGAFAALEKSPVPARRAKKTTGVMTATPLVRELV
jgi:purine-nucleoside phosphorylase